MSISLKEPGTLRRQLVSGSVWSAVGRALTLLAGLVSAIVLARILGHEEYGVYAFVFALLGLLGLPVQMGLRILIVRETAKATALKDWARMRGIWRWSRGLIGIGAACMIALTLLVLYLFEGSISPHRAKALLYGLPLLPLLAIGWSLGAALSGLKHVFLAGLGPDVLRLLLLAALTGATAFMLADNVTAATAFILHSVAAGVAAFSTLVILLFMRPQEMLQSYGKRFEHRTWLGAIGPLALISSMQFVNANTDLVMLGFFKSDADVGHYQVAVKGSNLAAFGLMAIYIAIQPHIADLYAKGDLLRLQKLASVSALVALATSLPVLLIFSAFGSVIVTTIFGTEYAASLSPLIVLLIGQTASSLLGPTEALLNMTGHEKHTAKALSIGVACNVVLNFLLIPHFSLYGAASATSISLFVYRLLLWGFVRKVLMINSIRYLTLGYYLGQKNKFLT